MDTKAFEVLIHSQYAFDTCRQQVYEYEDCKQTGTTNQQNPILCKDKSKTLVSCYKQAEKMDPMCLFPFNDARECMFKSDGNMYNCKEWINLYVHCQKDPSNYKEFLESSTAIQKKKKAFDFGYYRGHYDRYL